MRITLTLDDDVAEMLKGLQKREQKTFKQIVNEVLRIGIVQKQSAGHERPRYSTPELRAGECRYPNLDNIAEILAVAEGEDFL